jgi:hypothetical protein
LPPDDDRFGVEIVQDLEARGHQPAGAGDDGRVSRSG